MQYVCMIYVLRTFNEDLQKDITFQEFIGIIAAICCLIENYEQQTSLMVAALKNRKKINISRLQSEYSN